jgi:hypothetical protein
MMIVRAWPDNPPPGRPHVIDGWRRVPVDNYDYRGLAGLDDDVVSMDWDTACHVEDLRAFCARALEEPERCLAAPMRMYREGPHSRLGDWNLCTYDERQIEVRSPEGGIAHVFGFGMVYLPRKLIRGFIAARPDEPMRDAFFGWWHHHEVEREVRVSWDIRPVHLHYPEAERGWL